MTRQVVYVLGYPKSGTTWLSRLLGDALNSPVGSVRPKDDPTTVATEGKDRLGPYYVRQGHATPSSDHPAPVVVKYGRIAYKNITNQKVVVMVRDPRDIAISAQHHWKMENLCRAVKCMVNGKWPIVHGGGWVGWVESWQKVGSVTDCWTSYEALLRDTKEELTKILASLGIGESDRLEGAVKRQSFAARKTWTQKHGSDLAYGKEFQLRFLRKGVVGDWRNHDWTGCYEMAIDAWGKLMEELGYDPASL